jgi:hypothetical protein
MNLFALPVAVILLGANFILGGGLEIGVKKHRRKWPSFAAGVATAYVFVHLLQSLTILELKCGSCFPFKSGRFDLDEKNLFLGFHLSIVAGLFYDPP